MSDEKRYAHRSYGMALFSRQQHSRSPRLFGSALKSHYSTISFRLQGGEQYHHLGRDWYHATGPVLFEVTFSAAQFADLLTNMNQGGGVPCTITYVQGEAIEDPPEVLTEVERVKVGFAGTLEEYMAKARRARTEVEDATKSLGAKLRDRIRVGLDVMEQQLRSNIPFILEQLNEASDKVVTAAKAEIEAFATNRIVAAGLKALRGDDDADKPRELGPGTKF